MDKPFQIAVLEDSSYTAITKAYRAIIKTNKGFKITIWHGEKPYCCFKKTENLPTMYQNWFTEREVCVCSDHGTEHLLWGFDRNGLQNRERKSMCSKYTVTFGGWNEKQSFSSYFKVLYTFFFTTKIVIVLLKLFSSSVISVLLSIWKYLWKSESSQTYTMFYLSVGILTEVFSFLLVCFKPK